MNKRHATEHASREDAGCATTQTSHRLTQPAQTTYSYVVTQVIADFRQAMQSTGITPLTTIIADGRIHRFRVEGDRRGTSNGYYCLHADGRPAGVFGSWKTGQFEKWLAQGGDDHGSNQADVAKMVRATRLQREVELGIKHAMAASMARDIWERAAPANPGHLYLLAKQILPHRLRQRCAQLLVPLEDIHGHLWSLQTIDTDGNKRFLSGGRVTGCFFRLGDTESVGRLLICEGAATGMTLHEETGDPVLSAMNAGNLMAVAKMARSRWSQRKIVLCADDDRRTPGNPGLTAATAAAGAIGGLLTIPRFPADDGGTDFNDMRKAGRVLP